MKNKSSAKNFRKGGICVNVDFGKNEKYRICLFKNKDTEKKKKR